MLLISPLCQREPRERRSTLFPVETFVLKSLNSIELPFPCVLQSSNRNGMHNHKAVWTVRVRSKAHAPYVSLRVLAHEIDNSIPRSDSLIDEIAPAGDEASSTRRKSVREAFLEGDHDEPSPSIFHVDDGGFHVFPCKAYDVQVCPCLLAENFTVSLRVGCFGQSEPLARSGALLTVMVGEGRLFVTVHTSHTK